MNFLLDTHVFLWFITDNNQLSAHARQQICNKKNRIFVSAVVAWEIVIKAKLGRLYFDGQPYEFFQKHLEVNNFESLSISLLHAAHIYSLPDIHKDPFDRLLIAQSYIEKMPLISKDSTIARYDIATIW
jgi:PIN domain nuclease of toxin-antitoxin system